VGGRLNTHEKIRNAYIIFMGKSENEETIWNSRWEDDVEMSV
jgi:hypothetical protein